MRTMLVRGGAWMRSLNVTSKSVHRVCSSSSGGGGGGGNNSTSDSASIMKDLMLLQGHSHFSSILTLLTPEGRASYMSLRETGVVYKDVMLPAYLPIYCQLQSPLLAKYNFNASEFMKGCSHALLVVHKAIASLDLYNFANKFSTTSESNELLAQVLHPRLYDACLGAAVEMHKKQIKTILLSCSISRASMTGVNLRVVQEQDVKALEEEEAEEARDAKEMERLTELAKIQMDKIRGQLDKETIPSSEKISITDALDSIMDSNSKPLHPGSPLTPAKIKYPLGSVVASIDVVFEAEEEYETTTANSGDHRSTRRAISKWVFEGCLSGHVAQEWRIEQFEFIGSSNSSE